MLGASDSHVGLVNAETPDHGRRSEGTHFLSSAEVRQPSTAGRQQ